MKQSIFDRAPAGRMLFLFTGFGYLTAYTIVLLCSELPSTPIGRLPLHFWVLTIGLLPFLIVTAFTKKPRSGDEAIETVNTIMSVVRMLLATGLISIALFQVLNDFQALTATGIFTFLIGLFIFVSGLVEMLAFVRTLWKKT